MFSLLSTSWWERGQKWHSTQRGKTKIIENEKNKRKRKEWKRTNDRPGVLKWKIHNKKWWSERKRKKMWTHQTLRCLSMRKKYDDFKIIIDVCILSIFYMASISQRLFASPPSIHTVLHISLVLFFFCIWFGFALQLICYEHTLWLHFTSFAYKSVMTLTKENSFKLKFLQSHTHSSHPHGTHTHAYIQLYWDKTHVH